MPKLDTFTLAVVTACNMLASTAAILLIWSMNKSVNGIRRCALCPLLLCIGVASSPMNTFAHGKAFTVFSNAALFAAGLCLMSGIRAFRGFSRQTGIYVVMAVVYLSSVGYWLFIDDRPGSRVITVSIFGAIAAFAAAHGMAAGVPVRDRKVYWSTALIFAIDGVALVLRASSALLTQPNPRVFHPGLMDLLGNMALNLGGAGSAFGLSMATILKLQRDTESLAFEDALTGLPNRRMFEEKLEQAELRLSHSGHSIALVYCDVDDFKGINDSLGHAGGDKALRLVGQRLRQVVTSDVCLARVGGDEFVLLIENPHSREQVHGLIERLRRTVEGGIEFGGRSAHVRISCGLAMYPDDVGSVSDLIRLADAAMYMMKQHGRLPVLGEPAMAQAARHRSI